MSGSPGEMKGNRALIMVLASSLRLLNEGQLKRLADSWVGSGGFLWASGHGFQALGWAGGRFEALEFQRLVFSHGF